MMRSIAIIFLGLFYQGLAFAEEIHIGVAANFTKPMERLATLFEEKTGHKLIVSLGSSGQLYTQIKNGAPYLVFLSADKARPQKLVDEGIAVENSLFIYAVGQLVLWSTRKDWIDSS